MTKPKSNEYCSHLEAFKKMYIAYMENLIKKHLASDKELNSLISKIDLDLDFDTGDVYFDLTRSIVSQQLSTKAAATIHGRFLNLFSDGHPNIPELLDMDIETLRSVGLSRQKASYIQNVASFFLEEKLHQKDWTHMSDEEIVKFLTQIKGVGVWTVQMILMFSLKRPDILPLGDLGIQISMKNLYGIETKGKELLKEMEGIAENWRPYRSYACFYLWQWKDGSVI